MSDVKVYLSHGMGINSWALYLWLIEQGEIPGETFEAVAVDHGTDWPETYEYLDMMLLAKGYPVTVIRPSYGGTDNLYDYCLKYAIFPCRQPGQRWCTENFKVEASKKYYKTPCVDFIGFDASEEKRKARAREKDGVTTDFPLIEAGIDRGGASTSLSATDCRFRRNLVAISAPSKSAASGLS